MQPHQGVCPIWNPTGICFLVDCGNVLWYNTKLEWEIITHTQFIVSSGTKRGNTMEKLFNCAMDIGEQMLLSGAEVHRAEESVKRMCHAFGAKRVDVFIITSSMVVTLYTEDEKSFTQTRRITSSSTDFEKLHKLNQLSRRICRETMTEQEIREQLRLVQNRKIYPFWVECLCYALIAGAFTLFFGGTIVEMVVSFFLGIIVRFGVAFSEKAITNKIFSKFLSTAIATFFAFLSVKFGWIDNMDMVMIGNIMTLIPGIGLTNALRDLLTGDSIAGLLRCVEAALVALAIAGGYFLVAVLGGFAR